MNGGWGWGVVTGACTNQTTRNENWIYLDAFEVYFLSYGFYCVRVVLTFHFFIGYSSLLFTLGNALLFWFFVCLTWFVGDSYAYFEVHIFYIFFVIFFAFFRFLAEGQSSGGGGVVGGGKTGRTGAEGVGMLRRAASLKLNAGTQFNTHAKV